MEAVSPVCDPQRRKSRLEEFIQYLLPWKRGGYSCTLGTVIHTNLIFDLVEIGCPQNINEGFATGHFDYS